LLEEWLARLLLLLLKLQAGLLGVLWGTQARLRKESPFDLISLLRCGNLGVDPEKKPI
jgi:hypothetical protein